MTTATPEPDPAPDPAAGAPRRSRARLLAPLGAALAVAVVLGGVVLLRHDSTVPAAAAPPLYIGGSTGLAAAADRVAPVAPASAGGYEVTGPLPDGPATAAVRTFGTGPVPAGRFTALVAALGQSGTPKQVGGSQVLVNGTGTITAGPAGGYPWTWLPPDAPGQPACPVPDDPTGAVVCAAPAPIPYPAPDIPVGPGCAGAPNAGGCAVPASPPVGGPAVDGPASDGAGTSRPGTGRPGTGRPGTGAAGGSGAGSGAGSGPAVGSGGGSTGSGGTAAGNAASSTGSGAASGSTPGSAGNGKTVPVPAPRPTGPTPSEAAVRTAAMKVLSALGLGNAAVTVNTYPGGARVSADPVVDGLPTIGMQTWLAFDGTATPTSGGGFLGTPTAGPEYPLISARAAVATLPILAVGVAQCNDKQCDGAAPPTRTAISGARLGLAMRYDYGRRGPVLVPAWLFTVAKGTFALPVIAVDPAYLGTPPTPEGGPGIGTAAPSNVVPPAPPVNVPPTAAKPAPTATPPAKPTG
jgi:hypothetical protein